MALPPAGGCAPSCVKYWEMSSGWPSNSAPRTRRTSPHAEIATCTCLSLTLSRSRTMPSHCPGRPRARHQGRVGKSRGWPGLRPGCRCVVMAWVISFGLPATAAEPRRHGDGSQCDSMACGSVPGALPGVRKGGLCILLGVSFVWSQQPGTGPAWQGQQQGNCGGRGGSQCREMTGLQRVRCRWPRVLAPHALCESSH